MTEATIPSDADVAFFRENGYWVAPRLISEKRLERLRRHMDLVHDGDYETGREPWKGHWKKGDDPTALRKTDNSHWSDYVLRELATDYQIGACAARLMLSRTIRLWHDQLLYKPGRASADVRVANVGWHQDYGYWQCAASPTLLTAWVAFDDVTVENGCMQVVPRSHRWGLINGGSFFEQDMKQQEAAFQLPAGETFTPVPLEMKAGQVSFHHALTIHGSGPNNTTKPRRSLAVHLMTGDTRYKAGTASDKHMNAGLLAGQDGDLFMGPWFPVLYAE